MGGVENSLRDTFRRVVTKPMPDGLQSDAVELE